MTLFFDSANVGKIKPALSHACQTQNKSDRGVSDIIIRVWYLQQTQNLYVLLTKPTVKTFFSAVFSHFLN